MQDFPSSRLRFFKAGDVGDNCKDMQLGFLLLETDGFGNRFGKLLDLALDLTGFGRIPDADVEFVPFFC